MGKILHPFLLRASILVFAIGLMYCNKVRDILLNGPECQVQQYTYSRISTLRPYLYQKRFDPSGKLLQEISATFNGVGVPPIQHLVLRNHQKKLLLINTFNSTDTAYSIEFNLFGRPQSILWSQGGFRLQLSFTYKNGRLDSIKFSNPAYTPVVCYYDSKGNITAIKHFLPEYGQYDGSFYEYDYSRTAKNQVYFDETTGEVLHPLILLRYLDFFPELNPTNLRTRSSTGLENVYLLSHNYIFNHQIDADGKLLRYEASPAPTDFSFQVIIDWKCKERSNQESQK